VSDFCTAAETIAAKATPTVRWISSALGVSSGSIAEYQSFTHREFPVVALESEP
jgi:hypothetical protein